MSIPRQSVQENRLFRKVKTEQIAVPAHFDYLSELREFVTRTGRRYRLGESLIKSFKLAIDEAATNVIRHAYRDSGETGELTLRVIIRRESVTMCVIDQGKFFDPNTVQDPNLTRYVQMGKRGGLGIFLMRKIMDEVDYRETGEGNELRLTKFREAVAGPRLSDLMPGSIKWVGSNLKARLWTRTSAIIALLIAIGYAYSYFSTPDDILNARLPEWQAVARQIAQTIENDPTILEDFSGLRQSAILSAHTGTGGIREIALVDDTGLIQGHSRHESSFASYSGADPADAQSLAPGLYLHETEAGSALDYGLPLTDYSTAVPALTVHLRIRYDLVQAQISARRAENGRLAMTIIGIAIAAAFLLIYLVLAPLKKLAEFVRSGGEASIEENLEIDTSSEVGEIAQAFSDITAKFRESQKHLAEQERLQQEMQVAKEIQQTLLPHEFPDLEGFDIAGHYEAAQLVGGDYYDFVEIDRDTLGIVVADVSGKGVPGSMVMTMIRQALRTEARGNKNAADVLARLNELVVGDMRKGMFVTIFYVIIDSKRRRLNFASAGHNPMILYRGSTHKTYYLNPRGFPIGLELSEKDLFNKYIESDTIQLVEGDLVLVYTDGITEAMNSQRGLYGEERLLKILHEEDWTGADPFVECLSSDINGFTGGFPQSDDITFVTIHERTSLQKEEFRRAKEAYRLVMNGTSIREACKEAGLSTFMYYNKYKKSFEDHGIEGYEIDSAVSLEAKHVAIEDKSKLFDIIRNHPEYGAKRLSDEMNTEKYGWTEINEHKIYDELVRHRLNTRQLREAFVARGGTRGRRNALKPPGTPLLTLDGRVIIEGQAELLHHPARIPAPPQAEPEPEQEPQQPDETPVQDDAVDVPAMETALPDEESPVVDDTPDIPASVVAEPTEAEEPAATEPDNDETTENLLDALDEDDEARGMFAIDELIREEIDRTFSESATETEEAAEEEAPPVPEKPPEARPRIVMPDPPENPPDDGETVDLIRRAFSDTDFIIAAVDELLNEDVLDSATITVDEDVDIFSPDLHADAPPTGRTESADRIRNAAARRKAVYRREQLMGKGYLAYKNADFRAAIRAFEDVVELYPDHLRALKILGNAYFRIAEYESALSAYERVAERDDRDVAVHENSALVWLKLGDYARAIVSWQAVLKRDGTRNEIREKILFFQEKMREMSGNE